MSYTILDGEKFDTQGPSIGELAHFKEAFIKLESKHQAKGNIPAEFPTIGQFIQHGYSTTPKRLVSELKQMEAKVADPDVKATCQDLAAAAAKCEVTVILHNQTS